MWPHRSVGFNPSRGRGCLSVRAVAVVGYVCGISWLLGSFSLLVCGSVLTFVCLVVSVSVSVA